MNSISSDRSREHREGWCKVRMKDHLSWWGSVVVLMERMVSSLAVATVEACGRERERGKKKKDRTVGRREGGRERVTAAHTPMFKWWDKRIWLLGLGVVVALIGGRYKSIVSFYFSICPQLMSLSLLWWHHNLSSCFLYTDLILLFYILDLYEFWLS